MAVCDMTTGEKVWESTTRAKRVLGDKESVVEKGLGLVLKDFTKALTSPKGSSLTKEE
jgi:hypothetical protein